jgi:TonB-linked SusC/RagA family outer membrane protein
MRKLTLLILLWSISTAISAQTKIISGTVTDQKDNSPLLGVTVALEGTSSGTATDMDGKYTIAVPAGGGILIFTYLGFSAKSVTIGDQTVINVAMERSEKFLDEVVVVGYGSQIKSQVTGSIGIVKGEEIALTPVTSVEQALQGKTAGVFIEANNGKVGSAIRVRVRGNSSITANNEPLYVVDGIPINTAPVNDEENLSLNPLNDLDFNNVESIEILKDASAAAIYGSRGANGVVLITTKRGKQGKMHVDFDYQQGWSKPTRLREFMNAEQYVTYLQQAAVNGGKYDFANGVSGYASEEEAIGDYQSYLNDELERLSGGTDWQNHEVNTDWQKEVFQNATSRDIGLSISGGTEKIQYFLSGGYTQQDGIMINNFMNRASLATNIDSKISSKAEAGISLQLSRSLNNDIPNDNYFETPLQAVAQAPITPLRDSTGHYTTEPTALYFNPLVETEYTTSNIYTFRTIGNIYGEYHFIPSLSMRVEAGGDITNLSQDRYSGSGSNYGQSVGGYGEVFTNTVENYDVKLLLKYNRTFNEKHEAEVTGGVEYQPYRGFYSKVDGQSFPNDDLKTLASAAEIVYGTSVLDQYRFLSYFARANYSYNKKYLLAVSGRFDGSSRFGTENRYGFFPSISAGWILIDESFLSGNNTLSFLKLRTSYGVTGNAGIGNFQYLGLYSASSYNQLPTLYPYNIANPDLKWEKTAQFDIGIDYGFFDNRLNGELDYYLKNTSDLLLDVPIAATTGFLVQTQNIGKMQNSGIELTIHGDILVSKFKWSAGINFAANRNKVVALAPGQDLIDEGGSEALNVVKVDEPLGVFYGVEYAGVDPDNGDALFYINDPENPSRATTNDFNAANFVVLGDPNPDFIAGMTNSMSYLGFTLDFSFQSVYGNDVNLNGDHWMESNGTYFDNQTTSILNVWQQPGDVTDVPQARLTFENGNQFRLSRYISDGSYLRLKTLTLGYSLPAKIIGHIKINSLRFYVSAYNLITFTGYRGWDPEVSSDVYNTYSDPVDVGVDFYSAPQPKTVVLGLSLGL